LGKNVFYRPGGLLSFDIRGRMLFTRAYGSDWRPTYDIAQNDAVNGNYHPGINYLIDKSSPFDSSFIFANHRTGMGEIDAEGVITSLGALGLMPTVFVPIKVITIIMRIIIYPLIPVMDNKIL
jgi:hypothetical protein